MTYRGKVKDGKIELDPGVRLPEGATVWISDAEAASDPAGRLADMAVPTGVTDLAQQHDHYASGAPKKKAG